ncbi:conserved hypothetical protein [Culex quinquefasciatus]|uniref:Uncharacterized protein n=1 Tax=Culex quinquefasciatus TaxID=7176 RepID=B0WHG4_CULQU|nr:conserved hypothetical protein [Culex quinquefasciatus]|eukprot:XP_001848148.1 conserved hypothetical protein [Culex quinquefasciatus]
MDIFLALVLRPVVLGKYWLQLTHCPEKHLPGVSNPNKEDIYWLQSDNWEGACLRRKSFHY